MKTIGRHEFLSIDDVQLDTGNPREVSRRTTARFIVCSRSPLLMCVALIPFVKHMRALPARDR